jgi:hypothetical protein
MRPYKRSNVPLPFPHYGYERPINDETNQNLSTLTFSRSDLIFDNDRSDRQGVVNTVGETRTGGIKKTSLVKAMLTAEKPSMDGKKRILFTRAESCGIAVPWCMR